MRVEYRFFGLIKKKVLSSAERVAIKRLIDTYRTKRKDRWMIGYFLSRSVEDAGTFAEVKAKLMSYMGKKYLRTYQQEYTEITLTNAQWLWMLRLRMGVGFTPEDFKNHDKETGHIGNFSGVDCYVTK